MTTPPKKLTLRITKTLALIGAILLFVTPITAALVLLGALILLLLGCELKNL